MWLTSEYLYISEPVCALSQRLIALNTKVSLLDFSLKGRMAGIYGIDR
jgi:hypothetical protein